MNFSTYQHKALEGLWSACRVQGFAEVNIRYMKNFSAWTLTDIIAYNWKENHSIRTCRDGIVKYIFDEVLN